MLLGPDGGSFYSLGCLWGMLTLFLLMVHRGKRRIFVPKGEGIGGTCQGGHTGTSSQRGRKGGTCQWFIGGHEGVSFQKEKEMGGTCQLEAV